jgi:hypothetical protein
MKKFLTLLGLVAVLSLAVVGSAAGEVTTNTIVPINARFLNPCANGGAGEAVDLSGNLHVKFSVTRDEAGGLHLTLQLDPQDVTAVGETTGTTYRAVGITHSVSNISPDGSFADGFNNKFEDMIRFIGPGPGNNFDDHENFHLKVNSDDTVTLFFDTFSITCH